MTWPAAPPDLSAPGAAGARLVATFEAALRTVAGNVVAGAPPYLRAGGGYDDPWTRDASINAWLAVSLLDPRLAADTLLMVTESTAEGRVVAQDDQWWDQMIWVIWVRLSSTGVRQVSASTWRLPISICSQRNPGSRKVISVRGSPPNTT